MTRGSLKRGLSRRLPSFGSAAAAAALGLTVLVPPALAAGSDSPIKFSGLIDTGIYATAKNPGTNSVNAGQLFTDKHDQWVLNQAMLTAQKAIDSGSKNFNWGFNLQGFYGSDARYIHSIGLWDHNTDGRNQFAMTQANLQAHVPIPGTGGTDVTAGLFATPLGVEVTPANGNYFYSHNYIFNYGLPFEQTGLLTVTHLNPTVDLYLGVDTGVNTTFGTRGDNNNAISGTAGFGLNNLDGGKITIIALSHFGPENPLLRTSQPGGNSNADNTGVYLNDVNLTYKPNAKWTWITEFNYIRNDQAHASAGGLSETAAYAWNDWLTLAARGEIYADPNHFFVTTIPDNNGFVDGERGITPSQASLAPSQGTTYSEVTLGADIKLPNMPAMLAGAMIRPEVRYDQSLSGNAAYNYDSAGNPTSMNQFSTGMDLVVPVSF